MFIGSKLENRYPYQNDLGQSGELFFLEIPIVGKHILFQLYSRTIASLMVQIRSNPQMNILRFVRGCISRR
jgi:hypothetical protein